jgi:hypothetical protein
MKRPNLNFTCRVILAVFVLFSAACSKKDTSENLPKGQLNLSVGISVATQDVYNNIKAANLDDFKVFIYSEAGELALSYDRAADIPDAIDLEEGSYYVVAYSDNNLPAAFENDYYFGQSDVFQITGGQTTAVSLTCSLANIMVTVVYAQSVVDDFSNYSTTVSNAGGSLVFGMTEARAGYFDQGPLQIEAVLSYTNGANTPQSVTLTGSIAAPEAGKHYEIHIEASLNEGSAGINLNVDETYETEIVTIQPPIDYGDLLITEIMFNPTAIGDASGEWIELYNNSAYDQNLQNLVIRRGSDNDFHVISSKLVLAPDEYAVLANSDTATNNVDYKYSGISLLNGGDNIIINTYGTNGTDGDVICSVDYGASGFSTSISGKSIQLNVGITDADAARLGTNWCASTLAYNTGDLGTPGAANSQCQ